MGRRHRLDAAPVSHLLGPHLEGDLGHGSSHSAQPAFVELLCVKDRLTLLRTECPRRAVSECAAPLGVVVALAEARPLVLNGRTCRMRLELLVLRLRALHLLL